MKITVLFPTQTEFQCFDHPRVEKALCGVGPIEAAYRTARIIQQQRPDVLIMAGIAGVYPGSTLRVGDVALVASEREADLGFFDRQGFTQLADVELAMDFERHRRYDCPWLDESFPLPQAGSNTVSAALAPFVSHEGVDLENMEGAAFFHVCLAEGQRFYEIRAVSNPVTLEPHAWDFDASLRTLAAGLHRLVEHLLSGAARA